MISLLLRILIGAGALLLVAHFLPGVTVAGWYPAIIAAGILGFLNAFVKDILIILTFPITVLTLGLFVLVINAVLFMFVASFVDGFSVDSFLTACVAAFIVSIITTVANNLID